MSISFEECGGEYRREKTSLELGEYYHLPGQFTLRKPEYAAEVFYSPGISKRFRKTAADGVIPGFTRL